MMQLAIAPLLLLISVAPPPVPSSVVLLLHDGTRIETSGPVDRQGSRLTFRSRDGILYSIPASEVDREISREQSGPPSNATMVVMSGETAGATERPGLTDLAGRKLNDKGKLLHQIEQNHSGTRAPRVANREPLPPVEATATSLRNPDEWAWRREARSHQEAVRRATEDVAMLEAQEKKLEDQILSFTSLGYRARQFTYQTSELVRVREQLEPARLEIARAQRALDQFMDDARRQDILPGWLR